jgi:hypothetical protein
MVAPLISFASVQEHDLNILNNNLHTVVNELPLPIASPAATDVRYDTDPILYVAIRLKKSTPHAAVTWWSVEFVKEHSYDSEDETLEVGFYSSDVAVSGNRVNDALNGICRHRHSIGIAATHGAVRRTIT